MISVSCIGERQRALDKTYLHKQVSYRQMKAADEAAVEQSFEVVSGVIHKVCEEVENEYEVLLLLPLQKSLAALFQAPRGGSGYIFCNKNSFLFGCYSRFFKVNIPGISNSAIYQIAIGNQTRI